MKNDEPERWSVRQSHHTGARYGPLIDGWSFLQLCYNDHGVFFRFTWIRRDQKGKIFLDFDEARDYGIFGWQWHGPDNMQAVCISLQTHYHANTIFMGQMLF